MNDQIHEQVQPLLAIYRDLNLEQQQWVEAHLQQCAACAQELTAFQAMDRQLGALGEQQQRRFRHRQPDTAGLLAQIEAAEQPIGWLQRFLAPPARLATAVAGVLLLIAVAGLFAAWFDAMREEVPADLPPATTAVEDNFVTTSNDGSSLGRLAYIQDGNLWTKEMPEGEPRRLTEGGESHEPRWSPSGEWLAFRKGHFLWVLNADAPEEVYSLQTTAGGGDGGFVWSPVADRLAFTAGNKLQLLEAESGTIKALVSLPEDGEEIYRITDPFWKPDGTAIAYEQYRIPASASETFQGDHGIWLVEMRDGEPVRLYDSQTPEKGKAKLAGWSGDGRYLLFWQSPILSASTLMDGVSLYALPLSGGEAVQIGAQTVEGADTQMLPLPDFLETAPRKQEMVLVVGGGRETWINKRIALANPASGELWPFSPPEKVAVAPARSPDGESVAYAAEESGKGSRMQRHLEVAGLSQYGEPLLLTADPAYRDERPLWSADGNHILFARVDEEEQASLWLIPAAGGEAQQVVASLSPPPETAGWFATYGYVEWGHYYDWWREPMLTQAMTPPLPTPTPPTAADFPHHRDGAILVAPTDDLPVPQAEFERLGIEVVPSWEALQQQLERRPGEIIYLHPAIFREVAGEALRQLSDSGRMLVILNLPVGEISEKLPVFAGYEDWQPEPFDPAQQFLAAAVLKQPDGVWSHRDAYTAGRWWLLVAHVERRLRESDADAPVMPVPLPATPTRPAMLSAYPSINLTLEGAVYAAHQSTISLTVQIQGADEAEAQGVSQGQIILFDDAGNQYQPTVGKASRENTANGLVAELSQSFEPGLSPDAQRLTLQTGLSLHWSASQPISLDLRGRQPGDRWPVGQTVEIYGLQVPIEEAALVDDPDAPADSLTIELLAPCVKRDGVELTFLWFHIEGGQHMGDGPGASGCGPGQDRMVSSLTVSALQDGRPPIALETAVLRLEGWLELPGPWELSWDVAR